MPISWNPDDVREFLGSTASESAWGENGVLFAYRGRLLWYWLIIDSQQEWVSISGDDENPFGGNSLYEVYLPCNQIRIIADANHPEQKALEFKFNDTAEQNSIRLMLLKRPDGDLKVWPANPLPRNHPLAKAASSSLANSV